MRPIVVYDTNILNYESRINQKPTRSEMMP